MTPTFIVCVTYHLSHRSVLVVALGFQASREEWPVERVLQVQCGCGTGNPKAQSRAGAALLSLSALDSVRWEGAAQVLAVGGGAPRTPWRAREQQESVRLSVGSGQGFPAGPRAGCSQTVPPSVLPQALGAGSEPISHKESLRPREVDTLARSSTDREGRGSHSEDCALSTHAHAC